MTKIEGEKYHGAVDLLVGGTPCQDVSVAGKRKGFAGERSGLALSYISLLETMRPSWFVWENVPGVLSSNDGEDFKAFIRGIDEIGYSCAWRVLDAQYARVDGFPRAIPQRRRRVFVVGHLGADWRYPASVLFEPGCMPRDTPPRRRTGKKLAGDAGKGIKNASGKEQQLDFVGGDGQPLNAIESGRGFYSESKTAQTLKAQGCFDTRQVESHEKEIAPTLVATDYKGGKAVYFDPQRKAPYACYENHAQDSRIKECGECSPQINAKAGTGGGNLPLVQAIAIAENVIGRRVENGGNGVGAKEEVAYTQNCTGVMGVSQNETVRCLLPVECERLMGFPDNWTRIPWRGKAGDDCPDSPRYKACGNSMCVNVMRWIGMRIELVESKGVSC